MESSGIKNAWLGLDLIAKRVVIKAMLFSDKGTYYRDWMEEYNKVKCYAAIG